MNGYVGILHLGLNIKFPNILHHKFWSKIVIN